MVVSTHTHAATDNRRELSLSEVGVDFPECRGYEAMTLIPPAFV